MSDYQVVDNGIQGLVLAVNETIRERAELRAKLNHALATIETLVGRAERAEATIARMITAAREQAGAFEECARQGDPDCHDAATTVVAAIERAAKDAP